MRIRWICFALAVSAHSPLALSQWVQTYSQSGDHVNCLAVSDTVVFAGNGNGIMVSTNDGTSWTSGNTGLTGHPVISLGVHRGIVIAGTYLGGVFLSSNKGLQWEAHSAGLPSNASIYSVAGCGNRLFATTDSEVFRSTDCGASWFSFNSGLPQNVTPGYLPFPCLISNDQKVFVGTPHSGIYACSESGDSWILATEEGSLGAWYDSARYSSVSCFAFNGRTIFAGTGSGIFRSTDDGATWKSAMDGFPFYHAGWQHIEVSCLTVSSSKIFAGTRYRVKGGMPVGVYFSTNNGASWSAANEGLPTEGGDSTQYESIICLGSTTHKVLAATDEQIWSRPLSETMTPVPYTANEAPNEFTLCQNYPNPFNPTTKIGYRVSGLGSRVKLAVYDLLGRQAAVLVDAQKAPGRYQVEFDGAKLSSGVYIFRLTAGNYTESKRMILIR
jgi:hypothetical protein